jgi:hypothetical protein
VREHFACSPVASRWVNHNDSGSDSRKISKTSEHGQHHREHCQSHREMIKAMGNMIKHIRTIVKAIRTIVKPIVAIFWPSAAAGEAE